LFHNALADHLQEELALAADLGVAPLRVGDPGFDQVVIGGTIKWAVTVEGELLIVPKHIKGQELAHTVLTNGGPVLAAGEAEIAGTDGQYVVIEINDHSGHYRPDRASLRLGVQAFEERGITRL
jgi:hypothetical protein